MTSLRRRMVGTCIALIVTAMSLLPAHANAQGTPPAEPEPPSFLLQPVGQEASYFAITQEPGTEQEYSVMLGNAGTQPVTALTYVADAYTLVNGGFGVETAEDPASGATTWVDYSTETLDLEAGETLERNFTVNVPADTAPGQYIAGLVIQTAESIAVGDTGMLRQIIKQSIAVFVTVPGPESPELTIGQPDITQAASTNSLVVEVQNPGNVFLNPSGTVTMTTEDGEPVVSSPVAMGPVYAGTATTLELVVPTMLAPGDYRVSITLEDEETGARAEVSNASVAVAESAEATPPAETVSFETVTIDPLTDPDSDELQAVNVGVTLNNPGEAIPSAQLTLHVMRDGELVEDFPLNSSLVVPTGSTEIQQRYVPLTGWEPGTYSFELTLEAVDPNTGQVTVLATHAIDETIQVP